jgi:hypothetical protein
MRDGDMMRYEISDIPVAATDKQAADILNVSPRTIWAKGMAGEIVRILIGRSVRYDVRGYLERARQGKDKGNEHTH